MNVPTDRSVLFVCMGNICRSPTAHGVLRHMVTERGLERHIRIDSAGTHDYHPGKPPDSRSQHHAALRGYDLSDLRARQVQASDFERHDLILAMDENNLARLRALCPPTHQAKLGLFAGYCRERLARVVPDPYFGGVDGFEEVLDLVEDACAGLLDQLTAARA